jgi:SprB repeat
MALDLILKTSGAPLAPQSNLTTMKTTLSQSHFLPLAKRHIFKVHLARLFLCLLIGGGISLAASAQTTETISAGSFIVNMGITPQTDANGLKPYGMLYDLLLNYQVPIKWVINPSKGRDGEDFNHNGTSYRGGTFIIPAEFRTGTVNGVISSWQGQGVVGNTSVSAITVPVYGTIKSAPRWAINPDKPEIVIPYIQAAGIPSSSYVVKEASALGVCDDVYLIPHDDNISSANLATWNDVYKGYIWVGCKSGSVMENNVANFLTNSGLTGFGSAWGNPAVSYDFNADPPMQFMGNTAHQQNQANGANRSYTPISSWRGTTKKLIYITGQERVAMVYGPAFGNTNRGYVMISGGHDYNMNVTSTPNRVALIRAMLNFSYMALVQKSVAVTMNIPATIPGGVATTLNYTINPSGGSYSTQWSSSCGGTFSPNANSATVSYTPPTNVTSCIITVRLTDACGRVTFDTKTVQVGCVLTVTPTVNTVSCNGGTNGAINMAISGGSAPYAWNWSRVSPAGTGSGSGTSITGLSAGTYNVTVTSPAGCSFTFSSLVNQPNALTATATPTNIACAGQTGSVNLSVSGGTPGYTYSWTGPSGFTATTRNLSGRPAGIYNVTITDSRGCTRTASATITAPAAAVSIALDSKTDVSCNGGTNGAINITAAGGTPGYTYAWSDGSAAQDRTGLAAGTYTVTVTDLNGCTATRTEVISVLSNFAITTSQASPLCAGGNNGSILVTATGSAAPFNVSWSGTASGNPAGNEIAASGGSYTIASLAAGTYNITVTNSLGCTASVSRTLTQPTTLVATTTVSNILCFDQTGTISLTVSGGTGNRTFSWTGPSGFTATTQNISGLLAGTYNVTVTDANACTTTATANVTGPAFALNYVTTGDNNDVSCFGGSDGGITFIATGGTSPYSYQWSNGATVSSPSGLSAGTYTVTLTDDNGCTLTYTTNINQPPLLVLTTTITPPTCPPDAQQNGFDGVINLTVTGGTGTKTYVWVASNGGIVPPALVNSEDLSMLRSGTYTVTVTDANGCTAMTSVTLTNTNPNPVKPGAIKNN